MFRRHVVRDLSSYMDNQLSDREKLAVEGHLKNCQFCSQELSRLKLISQKLKTLPAPDLGPFFEAAVKEKIRDPQGLERGEVKMKRKAWYLLVPSGVLAGILVFVFVGQTYIKRSMQGRIRPMSESIDEQQYAAKRGYTDYADGAGEGKVKQGVMMYAKSVAPRDRAQIIVAEQTKYTSSNELTFDADQVEAERGLENKMVLAHNGGVTQEKPYVSYQDNASVIVIQPSLPATGEGEKIIRTAEIRLEVENGQEAYKKASAVCQELGGYLAASNFYQDTEGREAGTITMRIPKDKFLTALEKLSAFGKVEGSSTQSQDVSQEYANLKAQLDASMVVYNKMLEALQKRQNTIPEAVRIESELTPVLQRIANLKNQMESLNNSVSFTTVNLYFHEAAVSAKVLKDARQNIQKSMLAASINAVRFFGNAIPVGLGLIFWLVIIIGVALVAKNLIKRLFKRG